MAGMFIVIDGADGAGKSTQTERLIDAARARGLSATNIHFPSYQGTEGGKVVQDYLYGAFGDAASIHPKLASLPYAIDRFEQAEHLRELIRTHDLVVADRYVISNMAFQGAKLPEGEREAFTQWCATMDYEVFGNPREDAVYFLSVPTELSAALVRQRSSDSRKTDLHEANLAYQTKVLAQYHWLCTYYPHWQLVDCSAPSDTGQTLRPIEDIAGEIEALVLDGLLVRRSQEVAA
ncbi:MAG: dTMP kinase [Patescibacteria group bacterium]|jgi:dTMP kinase